MKKSHPRLHEVWTVIMTTKIARFFPVYGKDVWQIVWWAVHCFLRLLKLTNPREHTESEPSSPTCSQALCLLTDTFGHKISSQQCTNLLNPIITKKKKRETQKMMLQWVMKLKAAGSPKVCLAILWFSHHNILTLQLLKPCSSTSAREGGEGHRKVWVPLLVLLQFLPSPTCVMF